MKITLIEINNLNPAEYNPRQISNKQYEDLKASMEKFGCVDPIIININPERLNVVVGGHQRLRILRELGAEKVPTVSVNLSEEDERELNVRLNKSGGDFDMDILANEFDIVDLKEWGFKEIELGFNIDKIEESHNKLTDSFIVPPFSVLDSRQGYWLDRKKAWRKLINDNGESRENTLSEYDLMTAINNGASVLDPIIAEIANRWFGLESGNSFDCFAGDSVFGYVSDYLGNKFTGIELRQEQADLNNKRLKGSRSKYICDDGQNVLKHIKLNSQDLLFSCPPYFDLEVYSDQENDVSNQKDYESFLEIINKVFTDSIKCLKEDRFAVIVCGDIRQNNGYYRNFPNDIKNIFISNNCKLYNEMIYIEPLGSLPKRARRYMTNRKVGKCHQNILVFYKGDTKNIRKNYKELKYESKDLEL